MAQFIGLQKLAVGGLSELAVDCPVDRPTVIFLTVEPPVDRTVDQDLPVSQPPGRTTLPKS